MIIVSQSGDLLLVLSLHATCTHISKRLFIKNGCCLVEPTLCRNIPTGKMGTASCPPTGASYHVTQPAAEIHLHLLHRWCFHLAVQGTEKHSGRESSTHCSLRKHMQLDKWFLSIWQHVGCKPSQCNRAEKSTACITIRCYEWTLISAWT